MYSVKEIFYTLQGEGARAGRAAVFCRFSGCNFWSGREEDKPGSTCWFCDTNFVGTDGRGGGRYRQTEQLAETIASTWTGSVNPRANVGRPYVVFTGGEPLLQLDEKLIAAVHQRGFEVAVETNGSISAPKGIDWLTVSPKNIEKFIQRTGDELKLLYPFSILPSDVEGCEFRQFFLSPVNVENEANSIQHMRAAVDYCLANPKWQMTIQHHKLWSIP